MGEWPRRTAQKKRLDTPQWCSTYLASCADAASLDQVAGEVYGVGFGVDKDSFGGSGNFLLAPLRERVLEFNRFRIEVF